MKWGLAMSEKDKRVTAAAEGQESAADRLFITNVRDAKRKQIIIIILLSFFLLTFIVPQLSPIPQVQTIAKNQSGIIQTTSLLTPSGYAGVFNKIPLIGTAYASGVEVFLNAYKPAEGKAIGLAKNVETQLKTKALSYSRPPAMAKDGSASVMVYGLQLMLLIQLLLLGLGVLSLVWSYKPEKQLLAIKLLRLCAWALLGSYALLIILMLVFNMMVMYLLVFGVPLVAILGAALSAVFLRQVFMFQWYTHPETVMKKEITTLSYFSNQGTKPCGRCGAAVLESLESCPECGFALTARWKCKLCNQINTESREVCYSCGHPPRKPFPRRQASGTRPRARPRRP